MKKILYIATLLLFSIAAKSQTYVADTTDLKLIPSVNNGKIATIVATAYQGSYRATNVAQTPNGANIFASVKSGWYWVKIQDNNPSYRNVAIASQFKGIYNDGTAITSANLYAFMIATNGQSVFFPDGTYDLSGCDDLEIEVDINWFGNGRRTIIEGQSGFKIKGSKEVKNISFKDGGILFRDDAFTSGGEIGKNHFIAQDLYLQNCQMFARNVLGTNYLHYDEVIFNNIIQDTINSSSSGGAFMQWTAPAQHMDVRNILVQYNTDSDYVSVFRISGANNGLEPTADTTIVFDNITLKNININATNAPAPITNTLLMIINGEGADVKVTNLTVLNCNLPQFDLRGTRSHIKAFGWYVDCPDVVSSCTATDYFMINKSRSYNNNQWAFIFDDSYVDIAYNSGTISGFYLENEGDRLISNSTIRIDATSGSVLRAAVGEAATHDSKLRVYNSSIIHSGTSGLGALRILDDIMIFEMEDCFMIGGNGNIAEASTSDTTKIVRLINSTFYKGIQSTTQRDVKHLLIDGCTFIGNDNMNFSATERVDIINSMFRDDSISDPTSGDIDMNFEYGKARYVNFSNNTFNLKRTKRMGTLDHEFYADGLDTLIYNHNTGTVITSLTTCVPVRVDSVVYLQMLDNNIRFGGAASAGNAYPLLVLNSVDNADIGGNIFHLLDGSNTDNFVEGSSGAHIRSLRRWNNKGFTSFNDANTTVTYSNFVVEQAVDKDGNAYLTEATGYIQDSLYTQSFIDSALISQGYRELNQNDTLKTADFGKILYNDDSTNDTLYIPAGITADVISQYVGIETYSSASIVIIPSSTQFRDIENTLIDTLTVKSAAIRRVAPDNFRLLSSSEVYITASDTAAMLTPYVSRSDTASMLNTYRRKSDMVVATDYTGINNDGTTISQANFTAFITATNNRQVYWPAGTYAFAASAVDINPTSTSINWIGEGQNTILTNFDDFSPQGDYLIVRNMKFKNCDYLFRYDASETIGTDSTLYAEFSDLFVQRVKGITRYPETAEQWVHHIKFDNIKYDTITSSGVGISVNGGAGIIECTNLYFNGTLDSTAISPLSLSSEQDGGRGIDTAIYVDNVVINNFWVREGFGTAANFYNIYAEAQEGTVIKISNIKIANTNLPLLYLRGSTTTIFDHIDIRTDTLRTDFTGPVIICKSPGTDQKPAMIFKNSHIDVPDITAVYKENAGNVILRNNYIKVNGASKFCFNVSHNVNTDFDWTVRVQDNIMINASSSNPLIITIPAYVKTFECFDNRFIIPNVPQGASAIQVANANVGDTMTNANFQRNYFYNARLSIGAVRYAKMLNFQNNHIVTVGVWGLNAMDQAIIKNNVIQSVPVDSVLVSGLGSSGDFALDFSGTRSVFFQNNVFNLENTRRMYNLDFSQYGTNPDTVIWSGNKGTIKPWNLNSSYGKIMRIDQVGYLKVFDNDINFISSAGQNHVIYLEDSIGTAEFSNNNFSNDAGQITYFVEGGASSKISGLKYFNNEGVTNPVNSGVLTATYDTIKTSQIADLSGNNYLSTATGYTRANLYTRTQIDSVITDTLASYQKRPEEVPVGTSRNLLSTDVENIVRATDTLTLTIPLNFSAMAIDRTITILKATSVATVVTIQAAGGVTLNGSSGGSVTLTGPYTSGVLFKAGTNTYEFY